MKERDAVCEIFRNVTSRGSPDRQEGEETNGRVIRKCVNYSALQTTRLETIAKCVDRARSVRIERMLIPKG